jgi:magnesium-transporting ATPase (P-type)
MIFKKCTVLNTIFGDAMTPDEAFTEDMVQSSKDRITDYIFNKSNDQISRKLKDFFTMLAVCHTCMVEKDPKNMNVLKYSASSPDELALVQGAKSIGIEYIKRTSTNITIALNPIK